MLIYDSVPFRLNSSSTIIASYLLFGGAISRVLFPNTNQTENGVEGIT